MSPQSHVYVYTVYACESVSVCVPQRTVANVCVCRWAPLETWAGRLLARENRNYVNGVYRETRVSIAKKCVCICLNYYVLIVQRPRSRCPVVIVVGASRRAS